MRSVGIGPVVGSQSDVDHVELGVGSVPLAHLAPVHIVLFLGEVQLQLADLHVHLDELRAQA